MKRYQKITKSGDRNLTYKKSHPWLTFHLDTSSLPPQIWLALGEARSKSEHLAGVALKPRIAQRLHEVYLAKGIQATAAIEGNTLSENEVLQRIAGEKELPPSQEYLGLEIDNVLKAANDIIDHIESNEWRAISVDDIKGYNRQILDKLEVEAHVVPGEFRKIVVGVMDYRAPNADDCDELMQKLCDWINGETFKTTDEYRIVTGIIKAIAAHVYLAWIHPFGDGNGRTSRLLEVRFLLEAGVPSSAIHLLSNHYNKTRSEYYRRLSEASKNGGDLTNFFAYAIRGFVDMLREQLRIVKYQQWSLAWESYFYEAFGDRRSVSDRRQLQLLIALSRQHKGRGFVARSSITSLSPKIAKLYANKTPKTLTRDLNALEAKNLIFQTATHVRAQNERILAFLPRGRHGYFEAQMEEALRLTQEGGQLFQPQESTNEQK